LRSKKRKNAGSLPEVVSAQAVIAVSVVIMYYIMKMIFLLFNPVSGCPDSLSAQN